MKKLLPAVLFLGTISINADILDYYMMGVLPSITSSNTPSPLLTFDTNGAYDMLDYTLTQNAHQTYQNSDGTIVYRDTVNHSATSYETRDYDENNITLATTQDTIEETKLISVAESTANGTNTKILVRHVDIGDWVYENTTSNEYFETYEKCQLGRELSSYETFLGQVYSGSILELTCYREDTIKLTNTTSTSQYKSYHHTDYGVIEFNYPDAPESNYALVGTEF